MADAQESWREVGNILDGLGLRLRAHFDRAQAHMEGEGDKVRDAVEAAGAGVQRAFDALGDAVRDPAIQDDVRRAARSLSDAVATTFAELGSNVRGKSSRMSDPTDHTTDPVDVEPTDNSTGAPADLNKVEQIEDEAREQQ